ncbi:hypothetical protein STAFG_1329 [Streptomyces afghaniensis 772]|uniref:Uncharacterized protein n=1 Tax=Streptomyces afghaniensis 772 TaxID=1283301 RepID=S4MPX0_9ACTN|nr:hypothetical protein STAFG_1329 [Streptomyces afghaniensis 772]
MPGHETSRGSCDIFHRDRCDAVWPAESFWKLSFRELAVRTVEKIWIISGVREGSWSSRGEGGTRGTAERPPVPGVRHAQKAGQHPVLHLYAPRRRGPPQRPHDGGGSGGGLRPTPHPPVRRTHARHAHTVP